MSYSSGDEHVYQGSELVQSFRSSHLCSSSQYFSRNSNLPTHFWGIFPRIYILYNTAAILLSHAAFLTNTFTGGWAEVGCVSDTEQATGNVGLCTFANWALYLGRSTFCLHFHPHIPFGPGSSLTIFASLFRFYTC
jgi:hypothetical protein